MEKLHRFELVVFTSTTCVHSRKLWGRALESNTSKFFLSGNVIAVIVKFASMIHTPFAVRKFFHKVSVILNTLLSTLSKTQFTSVVKFPASTSEHITSGAREL
jgi:hypothetical protein